MEILKELSLVTNENKLPYLKYEVVDEKVGGDRRTDGIGHRFGDRADA